MIPMNNNPAMETVFEQLEKITPLDTLAIKENGETME